MNCKTVCFLRSLQKCLAHASEAARRDSQALPQPGGCLSLCWPIKLGQDEWFFCCLFPLSGCFCLSATHIPCYQLKHSFLSFGYQGGSSCNSDCWPDIGAFSSDDSVSSAWWITWTHFLNYGPELTITVISFYFNTVPRSSNVTLSAGSAVWRQAQWELVSSVNIFIGKILLKYWQTNHTVNSSSPYLWGNVRATSLHTVSSTLLISDSSKKPQQTKPNYILDLTSADLHCSEDK